MKGARDERAVYRGNYYYFNCCRDSMWMVTFYAKRASGVFKELASELSLDLKPMLKSIKELWVCTKEEILK